MKNTQHKTIKKTNLCIDYAETEGTGITQIAESEGTGIKNKLALMFLAMIAVTPMLSAAEIRLYTTDNHYVKGIYTHDGNSQFVEGLLNEQSIELISQSTLVINATGEGTGGVMATGEGTGGATGEGTGGVMATGEGTGGVGEGTGNIMATGEGTGGEPMVTTTVSSIVLSFDCDTQVAHGSVTTNQMNANLNNVQVYVNDSPLSCGSN